MANPPPGTQTNPEGQREARQGCATVPGLASRCPHPAATRGQGCQRGGEGRCEFGVGLSSGIPSSLPCRVAFVRPGDGIRGEKSCRCCRLTARVMGYSFTFYSPFAFSTPTVRVGKLGVRYPPALPPPASKWKDLGRWEKLGSSGKASLSKKRRAKRAAFHSSRVTGTEVPEKQPFLCRNLRKREGEHMEKTPAKLGRWARPGRQCPVLGRITLAVFCSCTRVISTSFPPSSGVFCFLHHLFFPSDPWLPRAPCWVLSAPGDVSCQS